MKLIQHTQAQLSNGQNISLERDQRTVILNKTLRIPIAELREFCDTLCRYGLGAPRHKRPGGKQQHATVVPGSTLLRWVGPPTGDTFEGQVRRVDSNFARVARVARDTVAPSLRRDDLEKFLCKEFSNLQRKQIVSIVAQLIHKYKWLQEVVDSETV